MNDALGTKRLTGQSWLSSLGLNEYSGIFAQFKSIEELLQLTETDLKELGVKNGAHRARMSSNLVILRETQQRRLHPKGSFSASNTPNNTPPSFVNHPDYAVPSPFSARHSGGVASGPSSPRGGALQGSPGGGGGSPLVSSRRTNDMSKNSWYHGNVSRAAAEHLVLQGGEGRFLIRDSTTQPGDFVLTLGWRNAALHFVVNREVLANRRTQFRFEEEMFDSVTELVQYYAARGKPVTAASGAVISTPVLRLASTQALLPPGSPLASPNWDPGVCLAARGSVGEWKRAGSQPQLAFVGGGGGGFTAAPLTESPGVGRSGSLPFVRVGKLSLVDIPSDDTSSWKQGHQRSDSEPLLSPTLKSAVGGFAGFPEGRGKFESAGGRAEEEEARPAPMKPSRVPTVKARLVDRPVVPIRNRAVYYEDDGKDYTDYDQVRSGHGGESGLDRNGSGYDEIEQVQVGGGSSLLNDPTTKPAIVEDRESDSVNNNSVGSFANNCAAPGAPRYSPRAGIASMETAAPMSVLPDRVGAISTGTPAPLLVSPNRAEAILIETPAPPSVLSNRSMVLYVPDLTNMPSYFDDVECHKSSFLPPDNKPLDPRALSAMIALLLNTPPPLLALHLTQADVGLVGVAGERDLGLGVTSGLELMTLPHGAQLRADVTERYHCVRYFVCVTLLRCACRDDCVALLRQWIELADQLRGHTGNLFSFCAIMRALGSPQVLRLKSAWLQLQREHASACTLFQTKLLPLQRNLDNATSILPLQRVTVPHIMPVVALVASGDQTEGGVFEEDVFWSDDVVGLDIVLAHLDTARIIAEQRALYRATARALVCGLVADARLADIFDPRTHARLLFGARSARADRRERRAKFEMVLNALAEKCES